MKSNQVAEYVEIEGGVGPIQTESPVWIDLAPLTVFIGPQGAGKSLISQVEIWATTASMLNLPGEVTHANTHLY